MNSKQRFTDYLALTKPRITFFVLVTVAVSAYVATKGNLSWWLLCKALLGTLLVAAGASALNQLLEIDTDAKMKRTENRPLPSRRLSENEVLLFGILTGVVGVVFLAVAVNAMSGFLAFFTYASYVFLYTPLKKRTTLNTAVGAIPGALPAVIGWAASGQSVLSIDAWLLFSIVFLWQFPHFFAIAWIYREDYARAGMKMLPIEDRGGRYTGFMSVGYCLALLPVSLLPVMFGLADAFYFYGAFALGILYLAFALVFVFSQSQAKAKGLLRASLVYLPCLFALLVFDHAGV